MWSPSFSADGTRLLTRWAADATVRLTDLTTGEDIGRFDLPHLGGSALSPDGERIALDGRVVDARSGEDVFVLDSHFEWADPYEWSPDEKWIAAGIDSAPQVLVWDATTGAIAATVHASAVRVDWSPDSTRLATTGHDGVIQVWEIDAGSVRERFRSTSTT